MRRGEEERGAKGASERKELRAVKVECALNCTRILGYPMSEQRYYVHASCRPFMKWYIH